MPGRNSAKLDHALPVKPPKAIKEFWKYWTVTPDLGCKSGGRDSHCFSSTSNKDTLLRCWSFSTPPQMTGHSRTFWAPASAGVSGKTSVSHSPAGLCLSTDMVRTEWLSDFTPSHAVPPPIKWTALLVSTGDMNATAFGRNGHFESDSPFWSVKEYSCTVFMLFHSSQPPAKIKLFPKQKTAESHCFCGVLAFGILSQTLPLKRCRIGWCWSAWVVVSHSPYRQSLCAWLTRPSHNLASCGVGNLSHLTRSFVRYITQLSSCSVASM